MHLHFLVCELTLNLCKCTMTFIHTTHGVVF